jgi:hypothetical protein
MAALHRCCGCGGMFLISPDNDSAREFDAHAVECMLRAGWPANSVLHHHLLRAHGDTTANAHVSHLGQLDRRHRVAHAAQIARFEHVHVPDWGVLVLA